MLGRAKWYCQAHSDVQSKKANVHHRDAWDKHRDLDSYEAKWLYVDALLKARHSIIHVADLPF